MYVFYGEITPLLQCTRAALLVITVKTTCWVSVAEGNGTRNPWKRKNARNWNHFTRAPRSYHRTCFVAARCSSTSLSMNRFRNMNGAPQRCFCSLAPHSAQFCQQIKSLVLVFVGEVPVDYVLDVDKYRLMQGLGHLLDHWC